MKKIIDGVLIVLILFIMYSCNNNRREDETIKYYKNGYYKDYSLNNKCGLWILYDSELIKFKELNKPYFFIVFKNKIIDSIYFFNNPNDKKKEILTSETKVWIRNNKVLYDEKIVNRTPKFHNWTEPWFEKNYILLNGENINYYHFNDWDGSSNKDFVAHILEVRLNKLDSITGTTCWINEKDTIGIIDNLLSGNKIHIVSINMQYLQSGGEYGDVRNRFTKDKDLTWLRFIGIEMPD